MSTEQPDTIIEDKFDDASLKPGESRGYTWKDNEYHLLTRIQKDELHFAWVHNRMYEVLSHRSYMYGWAISIMGFIAGTIGFILVGVTDTSFQIAGNIIAGTIGLAIAILTRQIERMNLDKDAENHRLIAASHSGLYDDIEIMKAHPTQPADKFLYLVKTTLRSIKESSMGLVIYQDVREEWSDECKSRGIIDYSVFDQLEIITGELRRYTNTNTNTNTNNRDENEVPVKHESEVKQTIIDADTVSLTRQNTGTPITTTVTSATIQPKVGVKKYDTLRKPGEGRGYDNKKLQYELDRIKEL